MERLDRETPPRSLTRGPLDAAALRSPLGARLVFDETKPGPATASAALFRIGPFVSGLSWSALLADYAILRGRLWSLVVISVGLGPWLCGLAAGRSP